MQSLGFGMDVFPIIHQVPLSGIHIECFIHDFPLSIHFEHGHVIGVHSDRIIKSNRCYRGIS